MKKYKLGKYILVAMVFGGLVYWGYSGQLNQKETVEVGAQVVTPTQKAVDDSAATRPDTGGQAGNARPGGNAKPAGDGMAQGKGMGGVATPVKIETLSLQAIGQELRTIGIVSPGYEVDLGAQTSGIVSNIAVSVGDFVTAGTPLYTLDDEDAMVDASNNLAVLANALESARKSYDVALVTYEETKILYQSGVVSENDLEGAFNSLENAKLNLEGKQINYDNGMSSNNTNFDDLVLKAPTDGIISAVNVVVGDRSSANDVTLINLETIRVETMVSGNSVKQLAKGDQVSVYLDDVSYQGTIGKIDLLGTNGTDSYGVEININNAEASFRPGYRVDVVFEINRVENQMVIDKRAVLTDAYGDYIFKVENNKAIKTSIVQGITSSGRVQITGAVFKGDQIIVEGQNLLVDQGAVKISGAD